MNIDQITNTANVDRTKKDNCFNRRIKGPAAFSKFGKIPEQVLHDNKQCIRQQEALKRILIIYGSI